MDKIIAQRLRSARLAKYMSQTHLGKRLGVTLQQIQKYEKGTNRLSGSRVVAAAKALGVSAEQIIGSNGRTLTTALANIFPPYRVGADARTVAQN